MSSDEKKVFQTLTGIEHLYSGNLKIHGTTSKSVGWKDEASQRLRFKKLAQVINPDTSYQRITINDYGCGYGAMFRYIEELPAIRLTQYYGYDISEEMLTAAKHFVADPRAEFIQNSQITKVADYSFVSGTFNVKLEASDELWTEYVKKVLINLAEKSTYGFAFNLLTTYVDWKQENLYYADAFMFFDFCKRHISKYVSLLHDYPLYEWTIIVRKEKEDYPG